MVLTFSPSFTLGLFFPLIFSAMAEISDTSLAFFPNVALTVAKIGLISLATEFVSLANNLSLVSTAVE